MRFTVSEDDADFEAKILTISAAADMAGMHPQTLRQYDQIGLVEAGRTPGGARRYSARDVRELREVQRLSQDEGINLAGIKRILDLQRELSNAQSQTATLVDKLRQAQAELAEVHAMASMFGKQVAVRQTREIAVWRPKQR
ncbi:heat shock protein transcriptional repressor HspR [Haloglycomyces albus]|uniref:heat shock protein transcriptional repressor HspR n=1 Tax=Haloglycomyces albus TaxID=526067 RepID=UPI0004A46F7E